MNYTTTSGMYGNDHEFPNSRNEEYAELSHTNQGPMTKGNETSKRTQEKKTPKRWVMILVVVTLCVVCMVISALITSVYFIKTSTTKSGILF